MRKPSIPSPPRPGRPARPRNVQLLAKGFPVGPRCAEPTRSETLRSSAARWSVGSLEDLADLRTSLAGMQRAYFCPPLEYGTLRRATPSRRSAGGEAGGGGGLESVARRSASPRDPRAREVAHPAGDGVDPRCGRGHGESRLLRRQLHGGAGAHRAVRAHGHAAGRGAERASPTRTSRA